MPEGEIRGDLETGEYGDFQQKFSGDDVVQELADAYPEPLTRGEIAEALGCSKRTAHSRLDELADAGRVQEKSVGARAIVWWLTEETWRSRNADQADH